MLTVLWVFPSAGALLILGINNRHGLSLASITSPRIEDLAALGVLLCHLFFLIQSRRFHKLLRSGKESSLTPTDT